MEDEDWNGGHKTVGVFLNGMAIGAYDQRGEPITDDSFIMFFNAHADPVAFTLPPNLGEVWTKVIDTSAPDGQGADPVTLKAGDSMEVPARTILVFRLQPPPDSASD
jgi:glycogen operon protein